MQQVYFTLPDGTFLRPCEDLGMYVKALEIDPPKPRTRYVELAGRDGALDMSEWSGAVRYGPREVRITLRDMQGGYPLLNRALCGRRARILLSDDPEWHFSGRCGEILPQNRSCGVTDVRCSFSCDPYRLKNHDTVVRLTTSQPETNLVLTAVRKPALPVFTADADCQITWGGNTSSHPAASSPFRVPGLVLTGSPQTVTVTGTGVGMTVRWRDGDL